MMHLNANEFFGLSDYLFDEQREQEKIMKITREYDEDSDDEILSSNPSRTSQDYEKQLDKFERQVNSKRPNKYHLITNSKNAECYIIDREAYLKNFLTFTTDKTLINKFLDDLVCFYFRLMNFLMKLKTIIINFIILDRETFVQNYLQAKKLIKILLNI